MTVFGLLCFLARISEQRAMAHKKDSVLDIFVGQILIRWISSQSIFHLSAANSYCWVLIKLKSGEALGKYVVTEIKTVRAVSTGIEDGKQ